LGIFDEATRAAILNVRTQLDLFNENVEQALMYQRMTFEVEDPQKHEAVLRNVQKYTSKIGEEGGYIADRIGRIIERRIPKQCLTCSNQ
jgi:hypothetical protein